MCSKVLLTHHTGVWHWVHCLIMADCSTGFGPMWLQWWINVDGWIIDTVAPPCWAGLWNTAPMFMVLASSFHFFMIEEISRNMLWERQEDSHNETTQHTVHVIDESKQLSVCVQLTKASILSLIQIHKNLTSYLQKTKRVTKKPNILLFMLCCLVMPLLMRYGKDFLKYKTLNL